MKRVCINWIIFIAMIIAVTSADAMLAGGRPNAVSGGLNAFAGVVNPANAVWVENRFDIGLFVVHQNSWLNNKEGNPLFSPGKVSQTYKTQYLTTPDAAVHQHIQVCGHDSSISLATYTTPGYVKLRTKRLIPLIGTTPMFVGKKTQVVSSVFSFKVNEQHSLGFSLDYFYLTYRRNGFQNADNPTRSVSPGNVTNNGDDHSNGVGLSLGWRWNISKRLMFGCAFVKKSYVGQFRKYRGYDPCHARNYIPMTMGAGFTYLFTKKLAGRLEVLWTGFGGLPAANNSILPNGRLNTKKRGSNGCAGNGLQDATFINAGIGYQVNSMLSLGGGISHRIRLLRKSPYIISHSYILHTTYDLFTVGANFTYHRHDFFLALSHGLDNHQSGYMPEVLGGGKFTSRKSHNALSLAWGYLY